MLNVTISRLFVLVVGLFVALIATDCDFDDDTCVEQQAGISEFKIVTPPVAEDEDAPDPHPHAVNPDVFWVSADLVLPASASRFLILRPPRGDRPDLLAPDPPDSPPII